MKLLNRIFIFDKSKGETNPEIILWWALRRPLFNFITLVGIFLNNFLLFYLIDGLGAFYSPGFFVLFWLIIIFLLANYLYSFGFSSHILLREKENKYVQMIIPKLFLLGCVFSFVLMLSPAYFSTGFLILTGKKITTPAGELPDSMPSMKDIAGDYVLDSGSAKSIKFPNKYIKVARFKFNSDSTLQFFYLPYHEFDEAMGDYRIVNAKGKWLIDTKNYSLDLSFDSLSDVQTGYKQERIGSSGIFRIKKDEPNYKLYVIVGDPDSWEGITLIKKK